MKDLLNSFDPVLENRVRLATMALLYLHTTLDFGTLKEMLDLTDGNLSSHLTTLEKASYLQVTKAFIGKKTNTSYTITKQGRKAYQRHLDVLEQLLNQKKK